MNSEPNDVYVLKSLSEPQSCDAEAHPSVKSSEKYKDLRKQSKCTTVDQWPNGADSIEAIKEQLPTEATGTITGHTYKDKWSSETNLCRATTSKKVSDSTAEDHSEDYSYCSQCGSKVYYDFCEKPCTLADSTTKFHRSRWKVIKEYFLCCTKYGPKNKNKKEMVVGPLQKSSCDSTDQS